MKRIVLIATFLISLNLYAQEKGRLGLLDVKSQNLDKALVNAINKGIKAELNASNRYILVLQGDMEKTLGLSPVEALENCKGDILCISQMGQIVNVNWLLYISLMKEKGSVILRGILYNVPNARIDLRLLRSFRMNESLVQDISKYVEEALKKIGTGSININAPEEFQVFIDGTFYSNAPVVVDGLTSGIHKVRIKKGNIDCLVRDVNVSASEISEVNVEGCGDEVAAGSDLSKVAETKQVVKFYEEPPFIIASSASLMFLATGIVLGTLSKSDEEKVKNAKCDSISDRDSLCEQVNAKNLLDSANTKAKAANISFGLAGAAALTAIGLGINYYIKGKKADARAEVLGESIWITLYY